MLIFQAIACGIMGLKRFTSLMGAILGSGGAYMVGQVGGVVYLATRELTNFLLYKKITPLPEIALQYALITSASALVGQIGGYVIAKKLYKALFGGD